MQFKGFEYGSAFVLLASFINSCSQLCTASVIVASQRTSAQLPASPFFSFPAGYQAENIRPRVNGQILITVNTAPELYQINPLRKQTGGLVHRFEGYKSLFGIVESQQDVFYILAGNFSGSPDFYGFENSWSVFRLDLRGIPDPTVAQSAVKVSKVVDIPQAQLLDGFAMINQPAGLLMTGDSQTGRLYLIDVQRNTAAAVLQDELLNGTSQERAASLAHVGINGIKFHDTNLYFTNTAKGLYGMVPINTTSGRPVGRPSVLANYGTYTDDLSFDLLGNQFISEPLNGVVLRPVGTTSTNNQTRLLAKLYGANSNAFGRTSIDRCVLYSTFDGALSGLARIDTKAEGFCDGGNSVSRIASA
ncbi:MAG: hypothetical protein Q9187_003305 [Circinaria calcarea]